MACISGEGRSRLLLENDRGVCEAGFEIQSLSRPVLQSIPMSIALRLSGPSAGWCIHSRQLLTSDFAFLPIAVVSKFSLNTVARSSSKLMLEIFLRGK